MKKAFELSHSDIVEAILDKILEKHPELSGAMAKTSFNIKGTELVATVVVTEKR